MMDLLLKLSIYMQTPGLEKKIPVCILVSMLNHKTPSYRQLIDVTCYLKMYITVTDFCIMIKLVASMTLKYFKYIL